MKKGIEDLDKVKDLLTKQNYIVADLRNGAYLPNILTNKDKLKL